MRREKTRKKSGHKVIENPDDEQLKKAKLSHEELESGWNVAQ